MKYFNLDYLKARVQVKWYSILYAHYAKKADKADLKAKQAGEKWRAAATKFIGDWS